MAGANSQEDVATSPLFESIRSAHRLVIVVSKLRPIFFFFGVDLITSSDGLFNCLHCD